MDKKKILVTERNRYGAMIWLQHIEDNKWALRSTSQIALQYCSMSYDELPEDSEDYDGMFTDQFGIVHKEHIYSVDPDGGPYMSLGDKFDDKELKRICEENSEIIFILE